ncbi:glycosyltransferase, partial [Candidatus Saccharibacteria bacterium]|nr:glycosyltransferase [Candidatus Saccharibacteria bacterium]
MKIAITSDMFYPTLNGVSVFSRNLAVGLAKRGHNVIVIAPSQTGVAYEEIDNGDVVKPVTSKTGTPKGHYRIYRLKAKPFPFYRNQTDEYVAKELTKESGDPVKWREVLKSVKDYLPKVYEKGFMVSVAPAKEMVEILDKFGPDVLHNQQEMMIGNYVSTYGHKNNIPVMTTNHIMPDNVINNIKMPKLVGKTMISAGNAMTRSFLERFDFVTMPTQLAIDGLFDWHHPAKMPMQAISNGIDLKLFHAAAPDRALLQKYGFSTTDKIITFVGRFDKEKHIPILMEAFSKLRKNIDSKLLLIGDGDELYNLQELAKELGIDKKTVFIGRVSRKELAALHRLSTVFVMPSPAELQS